MSAIDLSAATPATQNAVGEEKFQAQLRETALSQMLSILNQSKPMPSEQHRAAIAMLQLEGIAIAVEFLAQQCGISENAWVKTLRAQLAEDATRRVREAQEADQTQLDAALENTAEQGEMQAQEAVQVAIGISPEAHVGTAGAIRSALLMNFVQLSQKFPDSALDPTIARVAAQWLPGAPDEQPDDSEERRPA